VTSRRGIGLLLILALLLGACSREEDPHRASVQAYMKALGESDRALKIAALQTWLADWPEARPDLRAKALREIWNQHEASKSLAAARGWARVELGEEPSVQGRGMIYSLLYRDAVQADSRTTALNLAQEILDTDLREAGALAVVARSLILDQRWDVDLGTRLALRGAEIAEPGAARAEFLDLAGWGSFQLGRGEDSRGYLEAAVAELPRSDPSTLIHLADLYERLGDDEALLGAWKQLLERHMDLSVQARAESLHQVLGGDLEDFRKEIWAARLDGAEIAPDFELLDLEGRRHQLSGFRGRVVVLNFWHPTCDDCRKVLAALRGLSAPLSELALISVDTSHRPDMARKVAGVQGADWILLDDDQNVSGQLFDVTDFPTTLFLDPKGRVVFRIEGFDAQDEQRIREIVFSLVERG